MRIDHCNGHCPGFIKGFGACWHAGVVKSTKMNRTLVIRRDYLHYVRKYARYVEATCPVFQCRVFLDDEHELSRGSKHRGMALAVHGVSNAAQEPAGRQQQ